MDYTYDNLGRLTGIDAGAGRVKFGYTYWDNENNIRKKTFDHRSGSPYNEYTYDGIDRLTAAAYHNSDTGGFVMDDLGNRDGNQTLRQEGTVHFTPDPLTNRYTAVAGQPLAYDDAGNLTQDKDGYQFTYDYENRIVEIRNISNELIAEFDYDTQGRRIKVRDEIANKTTHYYYSDNWQVLAEYDGSGVQQAYYIFGNYIDEVLLMYRNGADKYYLHDHLYSPVALLDNSGNVVERYEYDAYGKVQIMAADFSSRTASLYGNPFYFTGREVDWFDNRNLTLQHNRHRYLSQYMGSWFTPDPGGYVDGLNLYQYVRWRPVIAVDPDGKILNVIIVWEAMRWIENKFIDKFIPREDPGRELARELMEHYVIGVGSYKKHEGKWGDFMREQAELQDAFSDKMREIAKKLCSGDSTSGSISETITGENNLLPYRLNRLASMRMTLHDPKNAIKIEDRYEVKNPKTKCCEVIFKDVKFTWVDTGELTDYMSTRLDGGDYVPDTYFMELEEKYLKYIPTSGPYPIEISWMGESAWKVHESQYSYVRPRVEYLWGWPHPSNEIMQPMPPSPGHR